jgi:hypothetical protein
VTPLRKTGRKFQRGLLLLWLASLSVLLCSCIDSREEIWLEPDGSGRGEFTLSLPAVAARFHGGEDGIRRSIDQFLEATPQLKNPTVAVTTTDGEMEISVKASFDSALDLIDLPLEEALQHLPGPAEGLAGTVDFRLHGRRVELTRTIDAGRSIPGSRLMPQGRLSRHRLVYIIHLPVPALESNATRTTRGGRTLVWDFPLSTAVRGPATLFLKLDAPLPRWLIAAGAGTLLLAALAAVAFRHHRIRAKAAA